MEEAREHTGGSEGQRRRIGRSRGCPEGQRRAGGSVGAGGEVGAGADVDGGGRARRGRPARVLAGRAGARRGRGGPAVVPVQAEEGARRGGPAWVPMQTKEIEGRSREIEEAKRMIRLLEEAGIEEESSPNPRGLALIPC